MSQQAAGVEAVPPRRLGREMSRSSARLVRARGGTLALRFANAVALEIGIDGAVPLEFPKVVRAHEPYDVSPQLDRGVFVRNPADHRPEDSRSRTSIKTDRR